MCKLEACTDPTEAGVWWRDDKQWRLYGVEDQLKIRNSKFESQQPKSSVSNLSLGSIKSEVHPKGQTYTLNLKSMEQVSSLGMRRPVKIIGTHADMLSCMKGSAVGVQEDIFKEYKTVEKKDGVVVVDAPIFKDYQSIERKDDPVQNTPTLWKFFKSVVKFIFRINSH